MISIFANKYITHSKEWNNFVSIFVCSVCCVLSGLSIQECNGRTGIWLPMKGYSMFFSMFLAEKCVLILETIYFDLNFLLFISNMIEDSQLPKYGRVDQQIVVLFLYFCCQSSNFFCNSVCLPTVSFSSANKFFKRFIWVQIQSMVKLVDFNLLYRWLSVKCTMYMYTYTPR